MEKAQIENFKQLFIDILSEEDITEGKLFPQNDQGDEMDQLLQEKENQLGFRLQARNAIYLKKVRKALQRIEDGCFGECEDCGAQISTQRLIARPTAELCIACKEDSERGENQTIHKNRHSIMNDGRVLPISQFRGGLNKDETSHENFHVAHMDYQDVVV